MLQQGIWRKDQDLILQFAVTHTMVLDPKLQVWATGRNCLLLEAPFG